MALREKVKLFTIVRPKEIQHVKRHLNDGVGLFYYVGFTEDVSSFIALGLNGVIQGRMVVIKHIGRLVRFYFNRSINPVDFD